MNVEQFIEQTRARVEANVREAGTEVVVTLPTEEDRQQSTAGQRQQDAAFTAMFGREHGNEAAGNIIPRTPAPPRQPVYTGRFGTVDIHETVFDAEMLIDILLVNGRLLDPIRTRARELAEMGLIQTFPAADTGPR